jgi:hypothetical protein
MTTGRINQVAFLGKTSQSCIANNTKLKGHHNNESHPNKWNYHNNREAYATKCYHNFSGSKRTSMHTCPVASLKFQLQASAGREGYYVVRIAAKRDSNAERVTSYDNMFLEKVSNTETTRSQY